MVGGGGVGDTGLFCSQCLQRLASQRLERFTPREGDAVEAYRDTKTIQEALLNSGLAVMAYAIFVRSSSIPLFRNS